jgi:hypothetical protein
MDDPYILINEKLSDDFAVSFISLSVEYIKNMHISCAGNAKYAGISRPTYM